MQFDQPSVPRSLERAWWVSAAVAVAAVATGGLCIANAWDRGHAWRWSWIAGLAVGCLLWEFRRHLPRNSRAGETRVLPTLGGGTALTLLRGLFAALMAGFLVVPWPEGLLGWAPAYLYLGVAVADFFDGYVARVYNHATELGAELDISYDAFGTLVASALVVHYQQLPAHFLAVGLAYYLFHGHMRLRDWLGKPVFALRPNPSRRLYAGFLFGCLPVLLVPWFEPPLTVLGGHMFAAPVIVGFGVDWLFAVGWISADGPKWTKLEQIANRILFQAIPVGLRLAVLPAGGLWLARGLSAESGWRALFALQGWESPMLPSTLLAAAGIAALAMTTTGWLGRVAALLLITLACLDVHFRGEIASVNLWLLAGSIAILLLGAGRGALWAPEDAAFTRRYGERALPTHPDQAVA